MAQGIHAFGEGKPKHPTQIISLIVGGFLTLLGLAGILFPAFAGFHLGPLHSSIILGSGITLLYNGYKDRTRDSFLSCLGFAIFFGLHALAGFIFGEPGVPRVGYDRPDDALLVIIPGVQELGKQDHILNAIISLVLAGGALDWWRRHTKRGSVVDSLLHRPHGRSQRPIQHH